ncbi:DUF2285 domain-containing protein [Novosphingobium decolorationis]|uniref:DUF2285 domain-containing protein n=1 Tax=Novosphingobium decolorationis TaxID=2698673 RepID=A0ABX8EC52_9SPHN|nr:DUF2285 domain-containing protein [Novosphingobium decolorationis]
MILQGGPAVSGQPHFTVDGLRAHAVRHHGAALLRLSLNGEPFDVSLSDLTEDAPLAAVIPLDEMTPDRLTALGRFWSAATARAVPPDPRITPQRLQRARQMLRAVDARHAGAIYRIIAEHLFPQHQIDTASWVGHPIRETTIRLARDGMKLVRGGYRALLRRPRRDR